MFSGSNLCLNPAEFFTEHMWLDIMKEVKGTGRKGKQRFGSTFKDKDNLWPSTIAVWFHSYWVHSASILKLLLFSQETGNCPLPPQRITSYCLSGGGRLFVLERLPPKTESRDLLMMRERKMNCMCVNWCARLWGLRLRKIPEKAGTRSLMTFASALTSALHLLWLLNQPASITGCCEAVIGSGCVGHPPALVVPVHDFKLFSQPPTEGGVEKGNMRFKESNCMFTVWHRRHISFPDFSQKTLACILIVMVAGYSLYWIISEEVHEWKIL